MSSARVDISHTGETTVPTKAIDSDASLTSSAGQRTPTEHGDTDSTAKKQIPVPKKREATVPNSTNKPAPLPGYKLVMIRREDGSEATVMRKMTPTELAVNEQRGLLPTALESGVGYKIVTVRNKDGGYIKVKRPIKSAESREDSQTAETSSNEAISTAIKVTEAVLETNSKDQSPQADISSNMPDDGAERLAEVRLAQPSKAADGSPDMDAAMSRQKEYFRRRRMQKFKGSLIRGFGTVLGSSVGHSDFYGHHDSDQVGRGHFDDIQDGDIIDSDQDWSDEDPDDNGDDHGHNEPEHGDHGKESHSGKVF
jgi:hypothetical protein